jgi:type VI protein secretion system component VasK
MAMTFKLDNCCYDKPVSERVRELEKELADLKAKAAAEAAAKKQTVGEKVAERLVVKNQHGNVEFHGDGGYAMSILTGAAESSPHTIRRLFAAAIDKAVADARAEQRKQDAEKMDAAAMANYLPEHAERRSAFQSAARYIRGE